MRKYNLNIAGYNICIESSDAGPDLILSERFRGYFCSGSRDDLHISVHSGPFDIPTDAEKVFSAPLAMEINGIIIKNSENFWSIYKHHTDLFIKTLFPLSVPVKQGILKFSLSTRHWDLYINCAENETDPLEYPLDGLILYYLTVINNDIMIHASGVNHSGHGFLFSGISGKGKSTIAGLWDIAGAKVIHDDRLIIRNISEAFRMFNTPVYNDDVPGESPLDRIYLIEHGTENKLIPVKGATAVSIIMANCIQHTWNREMIAGIMGSVSNLCINIPVFRLSFRPDRSVIDFILDHE